MSISLLLSGCCDPLDASRDRLVLTGSALITYLGLDPEDHSCGPGGMHLGSRYGMASIAAYLSGAVYTPNRYL